MHELDNKVRLINVNDYPLKNSDEFIGFICGLISQDHDLEQIYLDSFLKLSHLEGKDISEEVALLEQISQDFGVTFVLSVSADEADLADSVKPYIVISL